MKKRDDVMDEFDLEDEFSEIDFRLYINKFMRENENLINSIDRDNKLLEEYNSSIF